MIGYFTPITVLPPLTFSIVGSSGNRNLPSDTLAGDVCFYGRSGTTSSISLPAGWTRIGSITNSDAVTVTAAADIKVLQSSDIGSALPDFSGDNRFHGNLVLRPSRPIRTLEVVNAQSSGPTPSIDVLSLPRPNAVLGLSFLSRNTDGGINFNFGASNTGDYTTFLVNNRQRLAVHFERPNLTFRTQYTSSFTPARAVHGNVAFY
jgi:hypothetical protein